MNAGPQASGELVRGSWTLTWRAEILDLTDPPVPSIALDLFYFPDGSPPDSSAPDARLGDVDPFVDAAEAFGQRCEEREESTFCSDADEPILSPPYDIVSTTLQELDGGLFVTASNERANVTENAPVGPDRFAYFDELVSVALGDDSEAHAWLRQMNDGPRPEGSLVRGDWSLWWDLSLSIYPGEDEGSSAAVLMLTHRPTVNPPATPSIEPAPTATAEATPRVSEGSAPSHSPAAAPASLEPAPEQPFAASVPAPAEVSTDPIVVLQSAALAALLVFLMPFPGQLFNSTLEAHEDEVRRWFRLDRLGTAIGGIGAFWASWPGVIGFTLLATLLYGFLDPGFGLSLASLATFLGMLVGIVLVTAAFAVPAWLSHRRVGDTARLKVVPLSLLIGVGCVLLSRLTGFQPGYLYGLLIGLAFARELSATEEGRATAIGAVFMLAVALMAWLGLAALPASDAFGLTVLRTSLAALMVAGLEGVVFGLLPMRFLPGESLYSWNRVAWAALLGIGAFGFFHILINPASGYLSDTSRTPLFTVLALLAGFALLSVAFWAWFRFRAPAVP